MPVILSAVLAILFRLASITWPDPFVFALSAFTLYAYLCMSGTAGRLNDAHTMSAALVLSLRRMAAGLLVSVPAIQAPRMCMDS